MHYSASSENHTPLRVTQPVSNDKEDALVGDGILRARRVPSSLDELFIDLILGHILWDRSMREYEIRWMGLGLDEYNHQTTGDLPWNLVVRFYSAKIGSMGMPQ